MIRLADYPSLLLMLLVAPSGYCWLQSSYCHRPLDALLLLLLPAHPLAWLLLRHPTAAASSCCCCQLLLMPDDWEECRYHTLLLLLLLLLLLHPAVPCSPSSPACQILTVRSEEQLTSLS
jgi:hypothetical protein